MFILRKAKRIRELGRALFPAHISEPLTEDPDDLTNIHNPNIKEHSMKHSVDGTSRLSAIGGIPQF